MIVSKQQQQHDERQVSDEIDIQISEQSCIPIIILSIEPCGILHSRKKKK
jgi:hypothetical protein